MGDKSKLKIGTYQNPNSGRSKESIDRYVRGMREKKYGGKRINTDRIRKFKTGMTPGQAKIAAKAPPPNKIDAKDFAVLRAEKAKGRGMGLQDESVQPGKVMKARVGKSIKTGKISDMSFDEKMKRVESGQINKKTGKFTSMNAMRDAKGFQKGESAADFNKRRMKIMEAAKIAKSTRVGKILLPVVGAAVAAKTYLNSKMNKKKDVKKKMGGGMMKKYSKGGGADSGTEGERRSIMGVFQNKVNRYLKGAGKGRGKVSPRTYDKITERTKTYALAQSVKDKDRLTDRDIKKASSLVKGKMGGGMIGPSQRPGYSKGTMVKARGCKLGRTRPTKIT